MSISSFKSNYFKSCILRFIDYLHVVDCLNPESVIEVVEEIFEITLDLEEVKLYMYKKFPNLITLDGDTIVFNESSVEKDLLLELCDIDSEGNFELLFDSIDDVVLKGENSFIRYYVSKFDNKYKLMKSVV